MQVRVQDSSCCKCYLKFVTHVWCSYYLNFTLFYCFVSLTLLYSGFSVGAGCCRECSYLTRTNCLGFGMVVYIVGYLLMGSWSCHFIVFLIGNAKLLMIMYLFVVLNEDFLGQLSAHFYLNELQLKIKNVYKQLARNQDWAANERNQCEFNQ